MKHNKKITAILLGMFILTQIIGLAVIYAYFSQTLPYGMQPPEMRQEISLTTILFSFAIAITIIFFLTKFKAAWFLRIWFFLVVILALGLTINTLFLKVSYGAYIALIIAIPLAFYKVFKRNLLIHNLTELLIYPGIAAVFVPILSIPTIIILLIIISVYDIWAVWHSGFMQKMAKFQINELKFFAGFFVPYAGKKEKEKIKQWKVTLTKKQLAKKRIKVNLAILGGGDVVFPLIMAGVVLKALGLIPALFIVLGATIALLWLQIAAKKGKWYPAMPFIASGCFFGFAAGLLVSIII